MQEILTRINKIPGVRGTVIIGSDGLVVASDVSGEEDVTALAAVTSTVVSALLGALDRMQLGAIQRFVMSGSQGNVILFFVGDAILLTLARKDANMGMMLVELKDAAGKLAEII